MSRGAMRWVLTFGNGSRRTYYTAYHAEQFARALRLNGTAFTMREEAGE